MLRQEIEIILEKADYEHAGYSGCFDIIAKKSGMLLLKVLANVDSVQKRQAENMKVLSQALPASPAIIGLWTRREKLHDNIVYDRFDIPAFTPATLENILVNDVWPRIRSSKGGLFAQIDRKKLRERRERLGLSQSRLAKKARVTKKSIYEHEKERMPARYDTVKRLELLLGEVTEPLSFWGVEFVDEAGAESTFERAISKDLEHIGFDTRFVHQTPFNIIAETGYKRRFLLLSDAEENPRKAEKNEEYLASFSEIAGKPILVITKRKADIKLPAVEEKDLRTMTKQDVIRAVRKW